MNNPKPDDEFRGDFLLARLEELGLTHDTLRRWQRLRGPKKLIFLHAITHICPLGTLTRQWWVNCDRWNQIAPPFGLPRVSQKGPLN